MLKSPRRYRPWTEDEDTPQLKRLLAAGETHAKIGEIMDRHEDTIQQQCKKRGLQRGQSAAHTAMMARINYRSLLRRMARA